MAWGWGAFAALVAIGFGVGAFGTLVGSGGGFILTPVLLLLYPHDSPQTLTAISLTAVFFNAASGSVAYARQRRIDVRAGSLFAAAALPGSVAGALLVQHVSRRLFDALTAATLLVLAVWLFAGGRVERPAVPRRVALRRGVLLSLAVGFVSSFLGIGGGVMHVPLLIRALGFPTHVATATSHFVLAWVSGAGAITHGFSGSFHPGHGLRRALAHSLGVVVGAQLGARASIGMRGRTIEVLLAGALGILAVRLVLAV